MVAPLLAGGAVAAQAGPADAATASYQGPVFVSPGADPSGGGQSCDTARFTSIQAAIDAAPTRGSVVVCTGTYRQQVVISKPLTLAGQRATIDETGVTPRLRLDGYKIVAAVAILSSNVKFTGFTVQHAQGEGILAAGLDSDISRITISQNSVLGNGLGLGLGWEEPGYAEPGYAECGPGGDCGGGLHLTGVGYSTVERNTISGNSGGILLSDDTGPTHNNLVGNNAVSDNSPDAGITVLGRNPHALSATGQPQPSAAGVYRNSIKHNQVTGNGGAGVLLVGASDGTACYDNLVTANYIAGNGLAGVTVDAGPIEPGQFEDLSGNEVTSNVIDTNNLVGDPADLVTTGVLVFSPGPPVTVRIGNNHISDNAVGIWLSQPVTATDLTSNTFTSVTTQISADH